MDLRFFFPMDVFLGCMSLIFDILDIRLVQNTWNHYCNVTFSSNFFSEFIGIPQN